MSTEKSLVPYQMSVYQTYGLLITGLGIAMFGLYAYSQKNAQHERKKSKEALR